MHHSPFFQIQFADSITRVGLMSGNKDTYHREEIQHLDEWCADCNVIQKPTKKQRHNCELHESSEDNPGLPQKMRGRGTRPQPQIPGSQHSAFPMLKKFNRNLSAWHNSNCLYFFLRSDWNYTIWSLLSNTEVWCLQHWAQKETGACGQSSNIMIGRTYIFTFFLSLLSTAEELKDCYYNWKSILRLLLYFDKIFLIRVASSDKISIQI